MKLVDILKKSIELWASDLILSSENQVCFKIDWDVSYFDDFGFYTKEQLEKDLFSIMTEKQINLFKKEMELDFWIELKKYSRFRVNIFYTRKWIWAVFRIIKEKIPEFSELWLPKDILNFTNKENWLVLVTWGVWSWKSTTLATLIERINKDYKKHIITVEDPIEYIYINKKSLIEQREIWSNTKSFDNSLKYALRQASDVIMVWELRDLETFRLALRAAETWNLVFATLHTSWAARTISRVIDMFPWEEKEKIRTQLANSLLWVVWQQLIKKKKWKGRVVATEILVNNSNISNMIRKDLIHQIKGAIEIWTEYWMLTMEKSLEKLKSKWLI